MSVKHRGRRRAVEVAVLASAHPGYRRVEAPLAERAKRGDLGDVARLEHERARLREALRSSLPPGDRRALEHRLADIADEVEAAEAEERRSLLEDA